MTAKRDLKRRVRDRAARTGERYTAAREQVLGERGGGGVLRGERPDLDYSLADDPLREALLRGARQHVRVVDLDHEAASGPRAIALPLVHNEAFIARAQAGIGGISDNGHVLALHTPGSSGPQMVICQLWHSPGSHPAARAYALILLRPEDFIIALERATPAPG